MDNVTHETGATEHDEAGCQGRREFLVRAATAAGGLVLGLAVSGTAARAARDDRIGI